MQWQPEHLRGRPFCGHSRERVTVSEESTHPDKSTNAPAHHVPAPYFLSKRIEKELFVFMRVYLVAKTFFLPATKLDFASV
jgi:hypothetical protein